MKKGLFIVVFLICNQFILSAKKLDSLRYTDHKEFFLHWDNDIFVFKDYYYTQGGHLSLVNPVLRKNPVNHLLFRLKNADNYYGIGLIQEIYTPKDLHDTLINSIDRPYSGTLFIRSFRTSVVPENKLRLTNQLDLGVLGPLSGAKDAQRLIHEWLDLEFPEGWDFQIKNRPYINYNFLVDKEFVTVPGIFDFTGNSRIRVGNIHDDIQLGASFRIGRLNNQFFGLNLDNKKYKNRDFQLYLFGGARATLVLYNATLMGGIIAPKDFEEFKFNEIKHVVGHLDGGLRLNYKFLGVEGKVAWKTPEFQNGEQHGWGTISLYFRF